MSKRGVLRAVDELARHHNKAMSRDQIELYVRYLSDLDDGTLQQAAANLICLLRFFPKVAEMREEAVRIDLGGEFAPHPVSAWREVLAGIQSHGRASVPSWSHQAIGVALDQIGGYRRVCDSQLVEAERSKFCDVYEHLVSEEKRRLMLGGS
jgi:hypothetical protein|tara:strand:+ start:105 stop:560 length:456 start_codon:yes stop_codon:yes gene_type:complete